MCAGWLFELKIFPDNFAIIDSTNVDKPGVVSKLPNPYAEENNSDGEAESCSQSTEPSQAKIENEFTLSFNKVNANSLNRATSVINLPSYEAVKNNPVLYAHANRIFHLETNPGNARHLMQQYEGQKIWVTPPPMPLSTRKLMRCLPCHLIVVRTRSMVMRRYQRMK